jgi:hypothetical protein
MTLTWFGKIGVLASLTLLTLKRAIDVALLLVS